MPSYREELKKFAYDELMRLGRERFPGPPHGVKALPLARLLGVEGAQPAFGRVVVHGPGLVTPAVGEPLARWKGHRSLEAWYLARTGSGMRLYGDLPGWDEAAVKARRRGSVWGAAIDALARVPYPYHSEPEKLDAEYVETKTTEWINQAPPADRAAVAKAERAEVQGSAEEFEILGAEGSASGVDSEVPPDPGTKEPGRRVLLKRQGKRESVKPDKAPRGK